MKEQNTGRYYVIDHKTGRKFCIEPISERDQRISDRTFTNGGTSGDAMKNKSSIAGGSIHEEDSIITEENEYKNIVTLPPGVSPEGYIEQLLRDECNHTTNE